MITKSPVSKNAGGFLFLKTPSYSNKKGDDDGVYYDKT